MKVAKCFCGAGMALALVLTLAAAQSAKADDLSVPEGRVAVTYEVQLDWVYPPTQQTYHTGYTVTVWYDNGNAVQTQGYNEAMADVNSMLGDGWQVVGRDGPNVVGVTPW